MYCIMMFFDGMERVVLVLFLRPVKCCRFGTDAGFFLLFYHFYNL